MLEGRERAILERSVLPQFIPRQRWFGSKSRTNSKRPASATGSSSKRRPEQDLPIVLLYVRTYDSDGNYEKYQMPMAVVDGALADQILANNSAAGDEPRQGPRPARKPCSSTPSGRMPCVPGSWR